MTHRPCLSRLAPAAMPVLVPVLVLALVFALAGPLRAAPARPAALVEDLNAVLIEVMRAADTLGYRGRSERLAPVLGETFNFQAMAGIAAGRHWRALTPEQRRTLVDAFARMSVGTFAARFDGFGGERFEVAGEEPGPRGTVLVRNKLIKRDGEAIEINYLTKQFEDRWRVVDVYLDSKFSELAIRRSEYTAILDREGFDTLIRRIEDKLAEWAAQG